MFKIKFIVKLKQNIFFNYLKKLYYIIPIDNI